MRCCLPLFITCGVGGETLSTHFTFTPFKQHHFTFDYSSSTFAYCIHYQTHSPSLLRHSHFLQSELHHLQTEFALNNLQIFNCSYNFLPFNVTVFSATVPLFSQYNLHQNKLIKPFQATDHMIYVLECRNSYATYFTEFISTLKPMG